MKTYFRKKGRIFLFMHVWLCMNCQVPVPSSNTPSRGVWLTNVDSEALFSKKGIINAVATCKKYGFNTIYVVTWNRGLTLYPSEVMKNTFGIEIDSVVMGRDPLRELIEEAHAADIRVIGWFEFGFSSSYQETDGGHILRKKPHWAARDSSGGIVSKNGFQWMNAFDPEVQEFMTSLLEEAVQKYDLDGIQGDDRLPALPSTGGYDPFTVQKYQAAHNGKMPPNDPFDSKWVDWRANLLNQFMGRLHKRLKAIDPDLVISMAPSIYPWSKEQYLQDWPTWLEEGWVDEVCPQIYRYDIEKYQSELNKITQSQVDSADHGKIFPGILLKVADYYADPTLLHQMVEANRKAGLEGEVFFFYEGISRHPDFFDSLYQTAR